MKAGKKETNNREEWGFSLIESLIALGITLIVLAGIFEVYKHSTDMTIAATRTSELSLNIQTALDMMRRDFEKTDNVFIEKDGIPLKNNVPTNVWGNANRWCNPPDCTSIASAQADAILLPASTSGTGRSSLPTGTSFVFDAVTPIMVNNRNGVSILFADSFARNITVTVSVQSGNVQATVNADADANTREMFGAIRRNDLILLENVGGRVLQRVTNVIPANGAIAPIIRFGGNDTTGLNQNFTVSTPTVSSVTLMRRVTYYLQDWPDEVDASGQPVTWLMRQVNVKPAVQIIPGADINLTYDIANTEGSGIAASDVANPTQIQSRDIRMVNVTITNTDFTNSTLGEHPLSNTIQTKMAVRRYTGRFEF